MRPFTMIFGIFTVFIMSAFVPTSLTNFITDTLTENDKAGLIKMREEEKLAYEVYTLLDEKWDHQVFKNIKQSEARHSDMVKGLLEQYQIKDPSINTKGQYANVQMQKLYQELTIKGSQSMKDAFLVGAMIEDMDIADLDQLIANTTNKDLINVYDDLNRGSRNHMRAFNRQLEKMDVDFAPTFINKERYSAIINGDHEEGKSCHSNTADSNATSKKSCANSSGKACAGNDGKKNCGNDKSTCKSGKENKKGCCK